MRKIWFILKEMMHLVRAHKMYFIAPLLITLALLAFLAFYLGPSVALTFIYAGL